jgi:hypothetical protein
MPVAGSPLMNNPSKHSPFSNETLPLPSGMFYFTDPR